MEPFVSVSQTFSRTRIERLQGRFGWKLKATNLFSALSPSIRQDVWNSMSSASGQTDVIALRMVTVFLPPNGPHKNKALDLFPKATEKSCGALQNCSSDLWWVRRLKQMTHLPQEGSRLEARIKNSHLKQGDWVKNLSCTAKNVAFSLPPLPEWVETECTANCSNPASRGSNGKEGHEDLTLESLSVPVFPVINMFLLVLTLPLLGKRGSSLHCLCCLHPLVIPPS